MPCSAPRLMGRSGKATRPPFSFCPTVWSGGACDLQVRQHNSQPLLRLVEPVLLHNFPSRPFSLRLSSLRLCFRCQWIAGIAVAKASSERGRLLGAFGFGLSPDDNTSSLSIHPPFATFCAWAWGCCMYCQVDGLRPKWLAGMPRDNSCSNNSTGRVCTRGCPEDAQMQLPSPRAWTFELEGGPYARDVTGMRHGQKQLRPHGLSCLQGGYSRASLQQRTGHLEPVLVRGGCHAAMAGMPASRSHLAKTAQVLSLFALDYRTSRFARFIRPQPMEQKPQYQP
ncbi:hypothetical protein V8C44DRAFT_259459 [Trichoderma aethiopicum]